MRTITVTIALALAIIATACTEPPPEVGRDEGSLRDDGGTLLVNLDLWRDTTGCQMTPEEFSHQLGVSGKDDGDEFSTFQNGDPEDEATYRISRTCRSRRGIGGTGDPNQFLPDEVCITCCLNYCAPFTGCLMQCEPTRCEPAICYHENCW